MRIDEILSLRPVPAAGLFLALTRRCPLSCAHCSTDSSLASEQYSAAPFLRLVGSFTPAAHPEVILMSGGEALLRPRLVEELATTARRHGTRSYLLSGMFFARRDDGATPPLRRAIDAVDHFAASLDRYHEREVGRQDVFRELHRLLAAGKDCSLQVVGLGPTDPYLQDLLGDVRRAFGDALPVLVGTVGPTGRAREWLPVPAVRRRAPAPAADPDPCTLANWPLVGFDGTVVACCNQSLLDSTPPPHLVLGHAAEDGWPALAERYLARPVLRGLRTFGPRYLRAAYAPAAPSCAGYCETCTALPAKQVAEGLGVYLAAPSGRALEAAVRRLEIGAGAAGFVRRHGMAQYAHLAMPAAVPG